MQYIENDLNKRKREGKDLFLCFDKMKNFDFYYPNNNCKQIIKNLEKKDKFSNRRKFNRVEIIFNFKKIVGKIISKLKRDSKLFKTIATKDKHLRKIIKKQKI